jgi:hypothetical protein
MGKNSSIESDIFSVFASTGWLGEGVRTYPNNFSPTGTEYIRVSILVGSTERGVTKGQLLVDIFAAAGEGTSRTSVIADKLDSYLVGKSLTTNGNKVTQGLDSALGTGRADSDNPSLFRTTYTLNYKYYGAK